MEAKLKHLEFIQAVIARMATNSFLFKGWAITVAAALSGVAAVNTKTALLVIALVSTAMFWGLDGYYLWLERGFVTLHNQVAAKNEADIDFSMVIDKTHAVRTWSKTCRRYHLLVFYGSIMAVEIVGAFVIKGSK
jgi:hypothetical protein